MNVSDIEQFLSTDFDGFKVELRTDQERGDIILGRPPYNVIAMSQREYLRQVFEALDAHPGVRVIVLRAEGQHFSSGGDIRGFLEASTGNSRRRNKNTATATAKQQGQGKKQMRGEVRNRK